MDGRSTSESAAIGDSGGASAALLDRALFQPYLEPGEKILWVGRPGRIHVLFPQFWLAIPFLVVFVPVIALAAAVFGWGIGWIEHGQPLSLHRWLSTIPFIGVGTAVIAVVALAASVSSRLLRIPLLRRTSYALTSNRAIATDRKRPSILQAVSLDTADPFDMTERGDGSGSIAFGYKIEMDGDGVEKRVPRLLFDDIENVALVYSLVEDAAGKHRRGKRDA